MLPTRNKMESGHQTTQNRMLNDKLFLARQMKEMVVSVLFSYLLKIFVWL